MGQCSFAKRAVLEKQQLNKKKAQVYRDVETALLEQID